MDRIFGCMIVKYVKSDIRVLPNIRKKFLPRTFALNILHVIILIQDQYLILILLNEGGGGRLDLPFFDLFISHSYESSFFLLNKSFL